MEEVHVVYKEDKLCIEFHSRPAKGVTNENDGAKNRLVIPNKLESENTEYIFFPEHVYLGGSAKNKEELERDSSEESCDKEESLHFSETEENSSESSEEVSKEESCCVDTSNESSWVFNVPQTALTLINEAEEYNLESAEELQSNKVNISFGESLTQSNLTSGHDSIKEKLINQSLLYQTSKPDYDSIIINVNDDSSESSGNETTIDLEDIENELTDDDISVCYTATDVNKGPFDGQSLKTNCNFSIINTKNEISKTSQYAKTIEPPNYSGYSHCLKDSNSRDLSSSISKINNDHSQTESNSYIRTRDIKNTFNDINSNYSSNKTEVQVRKFSSSRTLSSNIIRHQCPNLNEEDDSDFTSIEDSTDSSESDTETIYSECDIDDSRFLSVSELQTLGKQNVTPTREKPSQMFSKINNTTNQSKTTGHYQVKDKTTSENYKKSLFEHKNSTQQNYSILQLLLRGTQKPNKPTKKPVTNIRPIHLPNIFRKL